MVSKAYSEEERTAFVAMAAKVGVPNTIETLGYPNPSTAYEWCRQYGVEVPMTPLAHRALHVRQIYSTHEKLVVCQATLDKAFDMLTNGEPARETYDEQ